MVAFPPRADAASHVVELRNVSRWYGNVVAVNDVTFTLTPGSTGLLGPNGPGKKHILNMVAGLPGPTAGQVSEAAPEAHADPAPCRTQHHAPPQAASQRVAAPPPPEARRRAPRACGQPKGGGTLDGISGGGGGEASAVAIFRRGMMHHARVNELVRLASS